MTADLDPGREAFVDLVGGRESPAVVRVAATVEGDVSPLAAYAALVGDDDYGFLLESAGKTPSSDPQGAFAAETEGDRHARYSFVGFDPEAVVAVTGGETDIAALGGDVADLLEPGEGDVLDCLRGALPDVERIGFPESGRQTLEGGLVGFLAYDAVYDLWLEEVGVDRPDPIVPDAEFVLSTRTLVFDHAADATTLVLTPVVRPDDDPDAIYDDLVATTEAVRAALADATEPAAGTFVREGETAGPRGEYEDAVRRAKEHVLDGDIYQGVISRKRVLDGDVDPLGLYEALREINPSPYMYLLRHDERSVVGASPETLVSVRGDRVTLNPIAGTCRRGTGPVEDRRLAGEMLADGKERAEHTMLVDLARNDARRVGRPGSVRVEEFMNVLKYSHVQHIESTVEADLARDADAFDATRATFPAGTLTGAPKVRAMEIIHDLEREPRGVYGGGVGYYSWDGDADFAIVIRTATVEHGDPDRVTVQAGAGIVADSDPASEYEETERKMDGTIAALERIEREERDGGRDREQNQEHEGATGPEAGR